MDVHYTPKNFFDDLMVVLVIYKMEISESPAFKSLTTSLSSMNQKTSIFIYDNSPETHTHSANKNWEISYHNDPSNPGVSKAYNEGFKFAKAQNKKWMLLVDQDTAFPIDSFELYQIAMNRFNCSIVIPRLIDQTAIVSPLKFYFGGGQRLSRVRTDQLLNLKEYFFHNSGLLVSTDVFEKAGKYDENFSLDFSDFSFVLRLRRVNQFFVVANIIASHHLATTSPSTLNDRLIRFKSYLNAARCYKKNYQPLDWTIALRLLLRATKLSFEFRDFQFIVSYFR